MSFRINSTDPVERITFQLALSMAQAAGKLPPGFPKSLEELERRVASGEMPQETFAAFTRARAASQAFAEGKMARQVSKLPEGATAEQVEQAKDKGITKALSLVLEGCANPDCSSGVRGVETLKKCARCKKVMYCGEGCQRVHWPTHKQACKAAT